MHDPDELATVMERWKDCIALGKSFDMVFSLKGRDGVFRLFLTRVEPEKDGTGKGPPLVWNQYGHQSAKGAEERLQHALSAGRGIGAWAGMCPAVKSLQTLVPGSGVVFATGGGEVLRFSDGSQAVVLRKPDDASGIARVFGQCL